MKNELFHRRSATGFTLIEVMIVTAIVAILAAIAVPQYRESVARSRRADAQGALREVAQWMERQYTISNAYNLESDRATNINNAAIAASAPSGGGTRFYTISFNAGPDTNSYTLQAVPTGAQTGDRCGTFLLAHTGQQTVSGATSTAAECWSR